MAQAQRVSAWLLAKWVPRCGRTGFQQLRVQIELRRYGDHGKTGRDRGPHKTAGADSVFLGWRDRASIRLVGTLVLDAGGEPHHFVENTVSDFALGHFRERQGAGVAR